MPQTARFSAPAKRCYDVVIAGGAVMGSSSAFWLTRDPGFKGSVLVVERDSTYRLAASALAASGIRQQYSNPVNVLISQFGVAFIRDFQAIMQPFHPGGASPGLSFREHGYLYCCTPEQADAARARAEMQRRLGAFTLFLPPAEVAARFPYVNVDDLGGASFATEAEGWFDNFGLLSGLRHAARQQGAEYAENEVVAVGRSGDSVTDVTLATGETIGCGTLVNAAGGRGRLIARMAGLDIPVERRKRDIFVFASAAPVEGRMPQLIDTSGAFCRPENDLYLSGTTPRDDPEAAVDDFETRHADFEELVWPALANRIPQFETIKLRRFWSGHYDFNTLDHNAIIGPHDIVRNFVFVNGFSGHGLQQSPAVGRAVSELIAHGGFRTLDLAELGYARVRDGKPFLEAAVI